MLPSVPDYFFHVKFVPAAFLTPDYPGPTTIGAVPAIEILEARARVGGADSKMLYELLFAFYFKRSRLHRAAVVMYEHANLLLQKLQDRETLKQRCYALSVTVETLRVLDESSQYILAPSFQILILSNARLELLDASVFDGNCASNPPPTLLTDVYKQLVEKKLYNIAWTFSSTFDISPYLIIKSITAECIKLTANQSEDTQWVSTCRKIIIKHLSDKNAHWLILRSFVEKGLNERTYDVNILRSAAEVFLQYDWPIPIWLLTIYEEKRIDDFLHLLISYGNFEMAIILSIKLVKAMTSAITSAHSQTMLPYNAIEWLFELTEKNGNSALDESLKVLFKSLQAYFRRLETFAR
ncbi:unnamed protein product [Dracunculus medinensis]|uniref:Nuclear pore complex protein Nup85 n=1 Tax=Dracunculus medinensis TaxID=318479 RepID=A0A0N4UL65_DRAME|nr:unnamed protein product [Dracunculus medinensis]